MRLARIETLRRTLGAQIQQFPAEDISDRVHGRFELLPTEPARRRLARRLAPLALRLARPALHTALPKLPFRHDLVTLGERFGSDASLAYLYAQVGALRAVLVPGCYLGSGDVQSWLRRGVPRLEGIDVYSLQKRWEELVPTLARHYRAQVRFRQASVEALPFDDGTFDLISSAAVLEHVRNLSAMVDETARVLVPGGWAHHDFGPLYYTWGGDHCIAAHGDDAGYDHLLLDEPDYQARISDQARYNRGSDPNLPFWARRDQFSFADPETYLDELARRFELRHVVVKISTEALRFRRRHPDRWRRLLAAGVRESTLLVKSLAVIGQKRR